MTVAEIQQAVLEMGYQFRETVFNDGDRNDCMVSISLSTNPTFFADWLAGEEPEESCRGWGRYPRQQCWEMIYAAVSNPRSNP